MAGLSAAKTLKAKGITNFVVLEARSEVGGRVQEAMLGDQYVEKGALWVMY